MKEVYFMEWYPMIAEVGKFKNCRVGQQPEESGKNLYGSSSPKQSENRTPSFSGES
jgi:hypothetical protein